jgi:hypothetical protein
MSGHAATHGPNRRDGYAGAKVRCRRTGREEGPKGPPRTTTVQLRPRLPGRHRRRLAGGPADQLATLVSWRRTDVADHGSTREFSTIRLTRPEVPFPMGAENRGPAGRHGSPTGARWAPPAEAASRPPPAPARTEPEARLDARLLIFRHTVRFFSDVGLPRADGSPRLRKSEPSARTADVRSAVVAR